jgi:chemotaxis signal transduction protein
MAAEPLFCLFHCKSRNYAVTVDHVAAVLDPPALVRVGLCPAVILGFCQFRRDAIPVVEFATETEGPGSRGTERERALVSPGQSVLIVQAARGAWGLRVDRSRTRIAHQRPSRHEPKTADGGAVVIGVIRNGAIEYSLLDVEATWQGLRSMVLESYARVSARPAQV